MTRREAILASVGVPLVVRSVSAGSAEVSKRTYADLISNECPKCGAVIGMVHWHPTPCGVTNGGSSMPHSWGMPRQLKYECYEKGEHLHITCQCGYRITEKCLDDKT
jgi:hypothetical protein